MRLTINQDEVAPFRKQIRNQLESGAEFITITLRIGRHEARQAVASDADQAIVFVWTGPIFSQEGSIHAQATSGPAAQGVEGGSPGALPGHVGNGADRVPTGG